MTVMTAEITIPEPVLGHYDRQLCASITARAMTLQRCTTCNQMRYPPGPSCPICLSADYDWAPLDGGATILSWVVFHRGYLAAYPPPYNCLAVRLDEGPVMISNLEGPAPEGSWIGQRVRLCYAKEAGGRILPRFRLDRSAR